jgi:hypothetical protein
MSFSKNIDAQTLSDKLSNKLIKIGFENIRVLHIKNELIVSFENNIYRWNVRGIKVALDTLSKYSPKNTKLSLIVLKNGISQIVIKVPVTIYNSFRKDKISSDEISKELFISYNTSKLWNKIKEQKPKNPNENKIDFVIYPQLKLQNTYFDKIYEIQLNVAPALEISFWKGMKFTGQVIFPIVNDLSYEGDFIRPGFITLSQSFRFFNTWFGKTVIGNFNENRYGIDFSLFHPIAGCRWGIGINTGLTGVSNFDNGQWIKSEINKYTWNINSRYYYPKYNLQFNLSYGKYIINDQGLRVDCTRYFGETAIGFYAMYSGGESNGGFHFAFPIPPHKRKRRNSLRIVSPRYFDWEYNAGTEFVKGRFYETQPDDNFIGDFLDPIYINCILNNLIYHEK